MVQPSSPLFTLAEVVADYTLLLFDNVGQFHASTSIHRARERERERERVRGERNKISIHRLLRIKKEGRTRQGKGATARF